MFAAVRGSSANVSHFEGIAWPGSASPDVRVPALFIQPECRSEAVVPTRVFDQQWNIGGRRNFMLSKPEG